MSAMNSSGWVFTIGLVAAWYSSNIGLLLLNKYLLSNYGFKYPIFLTICHMTVCSLLSYIAIFWMKMVPMHTVNSRVQFMKISALSLIFCASVVSGNISLKYLPVSFNQAIGATTPVFTAVFAYLMTLKMESWLTYVTLIPVVAGVIIAAGGEPTFHLFGFIMCLGATAARALKSVVQGILLSSEEYDSYVLSTTIPLRLKALICCIITSCNALYGEKCRYNVGISKRRYKNYLVAALQFCAGVFCKFDQLFGHKAYQCFNSSGPGKCKGAMAVVLSILIFKNPVSATGMIGYSLTVFGVILYSEANKHMMYMQTVYGFRPEADAEASTCTSKQMDRLGV
ncbi:UNVERIFIED_CONTAM: putative sugar phosphate/phosphate translocator [Sesamum angustifolium]|uniref:Sugar phosphate/phosphate translocator n=2 Tax=Sesamum TaxID=4181 RepID=A0AAW2LCM2_9LAMI